MQEVLKHRTVGQKFTEGQIKFTVQSGCIPKFLSRSGISRTFCERGVELHHGKVAN